MRIQVLIDPAKFDEMKKLLAPYGHTKDSAIARALMIAGFLKFKEDDENRRKWNK